MKKLKPGKLPAKILERYIKSLHPAEDLILGPSIGEDAAVIQDEDRYLVIASDPITFTSEDLGYYAVVVNANDIAVTGARPAYFLATVLLPDGVKEDEAASILSQISRTCDAFSITLAGGHTEITTGLSFPIIAGTCLGWTDRPVSSGGTRNGDIILQVKQVPIEAVSIVAREKQAELTNRFGEEVIREALATLHTPGISVVREAQALSKIEGIHALHDVTEGGIAAALIEMAQASNLSFQIESGSFLVHPLWSKTGECFDLPAITSIGSGCLLAAVSEESLEQTGAVLDELEVKYSRIGRAAAGKGVTLDGVELKSPERDAITGLFE